MKYEENLNEKIKQQIDFEEVRQAEIRKNAQIKQREIEFEKRRQAIQKQKEYQRKKIERDKFEKERLRLEKIKQEQLQLKKMRIEYINHIFENKQNVKQFKSEIILLEKKLFKLNPTLYIKKCLKEIGFSLFIILFLLFVFWLTVLWIMLHYIYQLFFVKNFYSWHNWEDVGIGLVLFLIFLLFSSVFFVIKDYFPKMVFKKDKKIEERIEKLNLLIRNEKLKIFDNQKSKK